MHERRPHLRPVESGAALWAVVLGGSLATVLVLAAARAIEVRRFGSDLPSAIRLVERDVSEAVAARAESLRRVTRQLATAPDVTRALEQRDAPAGELFDALERAAGPASPPDLGLIVYASPRTAIAWRGRPAAVPADRLDGPASLFVAPGPLGLRLVNVEPVVAPDAASRRIGVIAAERALSPSDSVAAMPRDGFVFETSRVPVTVRPHIPGASPPPGSVSFTVASPSGGELLDAFVEPGTIDAARAGWRRQARGAASVCIALTLLVAVAPIRRSLTRAGIGWVLAAVLITGARLLLWFELPVDWRPPISLATEAPVAGVLLRSPIDALLTALAAAGVVGAFGEGVLRWRLWWRSSSRPGVATGVPAQLAVGAAVLALVVGFDILLAAAVSRGSFDAAQLSLTPWSADRVILLAGILLGHAVVVWGGALTFAAAASPWRRLWCARWGQAVVLGAWLLPAAGLPLVVDLGGSPAHLAVVLTVALAAALAWLVLRGFAWYRHASYGRRLGALAAAVVVPSLALYPALWSAAERARERVVETRFAAQTLTHPVDLQKRLTEALAQIDGQPGLRELVGTLPDPPGEVRPDTAFALWQRTALAASRLTSAVEIYGPKGQLASRFALNFPEYGAFTEQRADTGCRWEVFGEAAPFGAEERRMLHAERAVCDEAGRRFGAIVVRVMLDYDALPFISSQSPYFEFFRGRTHDRASGLHSGTLRLVVYGWGRTPIYASGSTAWVLDDAVFARVYASREPFWTEIATAGTTYKVLFVNDRYGIYAVGYPRVTWFDHAVHLAELATLALLLFAALGVAAIVIRRLASPRARPAWRLTREVRTSFSRKLFLAFVAASIIPALVLALAIRAYVAARLRADVEAEAGRTAAVARRVAEEMLAAQRGGEASLSALNDDTMVWISRVIEQDVNIFVGAQLAATSERDLYASGLLPARIPGSAYRAIVLDRLPAFVGEDQIASLRYLMAAAPIRMREVDAVLTVPLALQQAEIEREIQELDRGVQLGVVLFILLGGGLGYWLAQRISDPVERLTRASRRIAAGELSARVFVRTADELQRLVEAFNTMAVELERQRAQLEHTNRLEAWAEMARQVAHDIKNPLTPIQLSAEHLRRVHHDRGDPMSPVLERCVDTILAQVRLLRRISAEFSSFASTPVVRREPTDLAALIGEVAESYRVGLDDRYDFVVSIAPDLPALALDRLLVGRAIVNVIENALYAMPAGGRLTLSAHEEDRHVLIRVSDSGVGMDADAQARVFEPYFSTKTTGTGLGLPIAKRNIDLHGGTVTVSSSPGAGTVVTFALPVSGPEAVDESGGEAVSGTE